MNSKIARVGKCRLPGLSHHRRELLGQRVCLRHENKSVYLHLPDCSVAYNILLSTNNQQRPVFGFLSGEKESCTLNRFYSFLFPPVNPLNLLVLGKLDICMSSLQCWRSYMWGSYIWGSSMCQTLPLSHIPSPTISPLRLWPQFILAAALI